ncbi:unnamed protein product [Acanthoscelides obtectus]|uniref:Uncharacterized protein n=1 Tax=Acanthoscelides obtectus TaxID=200917 RepID=A0A9P0NUA2_ACAOB|nr:unnamed protein product [Acanthoscelides obtectus]CAK1661069.1 hypothetical protein AOBTE_LOCUS22415 [Acanthoscelides obtectus]
MVNLQLPGDTLNLIKTKTILSAFLARVKLMKQNIGRGEFSQFPNLSQTSCQEDDVSTYVQHINALYSDFESRFEDILTRIIPLWIINPSGDIEETNLIVQEELTELNAYLFLYHFEQKFRGQAELEEYQTIKPLAVFSPSRVTNRDPCWYWTKFYCDFLENDLAWFLRQIFRTLKIGDKKRPLTERELQEIVDNFSDFDEDIVDFADESE